MTLPTDADIDNVVVKESNLKALLRNIIANLGGVDLPALAGLGVYPYGLPYVDVVLTPTVLTTAPYVDADQNGPGLVVIPAYDANSVILIEKIQQMQTVGDPWNFNGTTYLGYNAPTGTTLPVGGGISQGLVDSLAVATPPDVNFMDQAAIYGTSQVAGTFADQGIAKGTPIVMWSPTQLSGGTRSSIFRIWYSIISANPYA